MLLSTETSPDAPCQTKYWPEHIRCIPKLSRRYFWNHTLVPRPLAAISETVLGTRPKFHGPGEDVLQTRFQVLTLRIVFLNHQRRNAMIQNPIPILTVVIKLIRSAERSPAFQGGVEKCGSGWRQPFIGGLPIRVSGLQKMKCLLER